MAATITLKCYLCNRTSQTVCKNSQDFTGMLLAGFGGHVCKGGAELFHTPYSVVGKTGQLEE